MTTSFNSIPYVRVAPEEDDEFSELPPTVVTTKGVDKNGCWTHIENLDEFFTEVYTYHQLQGFVCLLLRDVFELTQYIFIVLFGTFLLVCVDYKKLFSDPNPVFVEVIHWNNFKQMPSSVILCLVVALLFWLVRLCRVIFRVYRRWHIRKFFYQVLHITDADLRNMQWNEVQHKLILMQQVHQLCIHVKELTELDIHNRILRQKNYMISFQNKGVIPCIYHFPFIGKRTFLTEGLKFNLNLILFNGPGAPFKNSWKLKEEYKDYSCRMVLAASLSHQIFMLGVLNFLLCPFIMIYQILYSFFMYAELIKRSPDVFGARRWSPYGRLYLRHFNELDHEFQSRLNKAYMPATRYMNVFTSPIITIFAKNIAFFSGAILAVLLGLSFYDKDVLTAEHVLSFMATLGIIIKICSGFIPDEHMVFCPETLMKQILSNTHYIPEEWKGRAHTMEVREEFSKMFQYKFIYLLEELMSPLLTPFILCFGLRYKALQIVDFYRNFTVEVAGLGDVCSFAQMDIRKHGAKNWSDEGCSKEDQILSAESQAENAKTELSLLNFSIKNPDWKPSSYGKQFIETIKEQAFQQSLSHSLSSNQTPFNAGTSFDFTNFIGLQSIAYPALDPAIMVSRNDDVLRNSIMYLHEVQNRRPVSVTSLKSSYGDNAFENSDLRRTWPSATSRQTSSGLNKENVLPKYSAMKNPADDRL
ncbi:autophagy-related protein 9A isoform X2 [Hydra vulgaris]|uniref:Autophagy-related protein 9 n=1 Tax=Hydra vulgaris TaxID=6087 RepID=A0ABM4CYV5_HYDVU